ncbi:MAG: ferritin [Candidatus Heimdallarchaeota archaeon]|nr:ferritin [Candidatus Heimdallarchaeota archaeon]
MVKKMGKSNRDLVKDLDVDKVIEQLNKAYADEWVAFYQYLTMAFIATGHRAFAFANAVKDIAMVELEHLEELAERMNQLGTQPIIPISELNEKANCKFPKKIPEETDLEGMAKLILHDERCAIEVYDKIMEMTKDKDTVTYNLALHIIEEEIEHEDKMMTFLGE